MAIINTTHNLVNGLGLEGKEEQVGVETAG
jgi:hypothetical protein